MLFDGFSYSLPANKNVPVDLTLRTLRLIAPLNLDEEHYIKDFGSTLYVWKLVRNTQAEVQKNKKQEILDDFRNSGYTIVNDRFWTITDGFINPGTDDYIIENPPTSENDTLTRNYQFQLRVNINYIQDDPEATTGTFDHTYTLSYIGEFISIVYSG